VRRCCGSMGAGENLLASARSWHTTRPQIGCEVLSAGRLSVSNAASDSRTSSVLDCQRLSQSALRLVASAAPSLKANHEPVASERATPTTLRPLTSIEVKSE
jgi:hypothetical protein